MPSLVTLEESKVDSSLQDNVKISFNWSECIFYDGSSLDLHSILQSGLIVGGKDTKEGRQTTFFTAVNSVSELQKDERYDVTEPQKKYRTQRGKCTSAHEKGLGFRQTRFNAFILHDSVPANCLEKVVNAKTEEILFHKTHLLPLKVILRNAWLHELDS